jgi:transcriptional regulator with XRE-family HTH domain
MDGSTGTASFGERLRGWRGRRRRSQLDLALDAEISTRHLSFLETGRAQPSRAMVLRLAEQLDIPLRERNALLLAAGYAPAFPERGFGDPSLATIRGTIEQLLAAHMPFPAAVVDRHWTLVAANAALPPLLAGCAGALLAPPVNVLRLALHPDGVAPRIENLAAWRAHLLDRLARQVSHTADPALAALHDELSAYPAPPRDEPSCDPGITVPLVLRAGDRTLRFFSTTLVFGSPRDVLLSELAIETFLPADDATRVALSAAPAA